MNDKKNSTQRIAIVLTALFFLAMGIEAAYYYSTVASLTVQGQRDAIRISSLHLARELSQAPSYSVYIGATGRFAHRNDDKIIVVDVYYLFTTYTIITTVDITNQEVIETIQRKSGGTGE